MRACNIGRLSYYFCSFYRQIGLLLLPCLLIFHNLKQTRWVTYLYLTLEGEGEGGGGGGGEAGGGGEEAVSHEQRDDNKMRRFATFLFSQQGRGRVGARACL